MIKGGASREICGLMPAKSNDKVIKDQMQLKCEGFGADFEELEKGSAEKRRRGTFLIERFEEKGSLPASYNLRSTFTGQRCQIVREGIYCGSAPSASTIEGNVAIKRWAAWLEADSVPNTPNQRDSALKKYGVKKEQMRKKVIAAARPAKCSARMPKEEEEIGTVIELYGGPNEPKALDVFFVLRGSFWTSVPATILCGLGVSTGSIVGGVTGGLVGGVAGGVAGCGLGWAADYLLRSLVVDENYLRWALRTKLSSAAEAVSNMIEGAAQIEVPRMT